MKKLAVVMAVVLMAGVAGCCENPDVFKKIGYSMITVQNSYDPLVGQFLNDKTNTKVAAAVVAADTTLALAGILQDQWCPKQSKVDQLTLQAEEAKKLAEQAGVK